MTVNSITASANPSTSASVSFNFYQYGLAVISDCAKAVVFQITGAPAGTSLPMAASSAIVPGNALGTLSVAGQTGAITFGTGAMVSVPTSSIFWIGPGQDGDGALFRGDLYCPPLDCAAGSYKIASYEVVPDIENMQVLYAIQGASGGASTYYYTTADQVNTIGAWNSVVSVKIALLAASPANTVPAPAAAPTYTLDGATVTAPVDTRQRQVYEATMTLRNALP
jgi:hypothetical protein